MKLRQKIIIIFSALSLGGCTLINHAAEPVRVVWGSSTRALEAARDQAISKTYNCDFDACYDTVLEIIKERKYLLFINQRLKKRIVVMSIPGNVDTTEVGIFFSKFTTSVKVDISSLSSTAQERVASAMFDGLDKKFQTQGFFPASREWK